MNLALSSSAITDRGDAFIAPCAFRSPSPSAFTSACGPAKSGALVAEDDDSVLALLRSGCFDDTSPRFGLLQRSRGFSLSTIERSVN
jgi:hypothetical protein